MYIFRVRYIIFVSFCFAYVAPFSVCSDMILYLGYYLINYAEYCTYTTYFTVGNITLMRRIANESSFSNKLRVQL